MKCIWGDKGYLGMRGEIHVSYVAKPGGFERRRRSAALLSIIAPLETLGAPGAATKGKSAIWS